MMTHWVFMPVDKNLHALSLVIIMWMRWMLDAMVL